MLATFDNPGKAAHLDSQERGRERVCVCFCVRMLCAVKAVEARDEEKKGKKPISSASR